MRIVTLFLKVFLIVFGILFLMVFTGLITPYEQVEMVEPTLAIAPLVVAAIIAAAAQTGSFIYKGVKGRKAKKEAEALKAGGVDQWKESMGFTDYAKPEAYGEYKDYQKTLLGLSGRQEMPGYSQQKQDINAATANTLSSAQNLQGSDSAAVLLGAGQDRLRALRGLGIQASQYGQNQQNMARGAYGQAIAQGAQYEDKAFDYNKWIPQQQFANTFMAERNMGNQMQMGAVDQMAGAATQGANMYAQQAWYNNMQPQQDGGNQGGGMNPAWQGPQYNYGQNQWGPSNNNQYPLNFGTGQYTPQNYQY